MAGKSSKNSSKGSFMRKGQTGGLYGAAATPKKSGLIFGPQQKPSKSR